MDKKNHSKAETTINHTTTNVKSKLQIPIPWKKKIVKIFVNFLKKIKEIPKIKNVNNNGNCFKDRVYDSDFGSQLFYSNLFKDFFQ